MNITCTKCKKNYGYSKEEIFDSGTFWEPILTIKCRGCGTLIKKKLPKMSLDNAKFYSRKDHIEVVIEHSKPTCKERAEKADVREYWVQQYFLYNYKKLGFTNIGGPFDIGPDFASNYKGKNIYIEVERQCSDYIKHGHHKDSRFKKVAFLVVLVKGNITATVKKNLPKRIVSIDMKDFVDWWSEKAYKYAREKRVNAMLSMVADEFRRRFSEAYFLVCDRTKSDMAACSIAPCDECVYGPETIPNFHEMAIKFIMSYKHVITSSDFKLTSIRPFEIDRFYKKSLKNILG